MNLRILLCNIILVVIISPSFAEEIEAPEEYPSLYEKEFGENCADVLTVRNASTLDTKLDEEDIKRVRENEEIVRKFIKNKKSIFEFLQQTNLVLVKGALKFLAWANHHKYTYYFITTGVPQDIVYLRANGVEGAKKENQKIQGMQDSLVSFPSDIRHDILNALLTREYVRIVKHLKGGVERKELEIPKNGWIIFSPEDFRFGNIGYRKVSINNFGELKKEYERVMDFGFDPDSKVTNRGFINYLLKNWIEDRYIEQSYNQRALDIYRQELKKTNALHDKEHRMNEEHKLDKILEVEKFKAPLYFRLKQARRELSSEIEYYTGKRSDSDLMEDGNRKLSLSQLIYLGIDGAHITFDLKMIRHMILAAPLVVGTFAAGKVGVYGYNVVTGKELFTDYSFIQAQDEKVYSEGVIDFLEEHGVDTNTPFARWESEDKKLYYDIKSQRDAYLFSQFKKREKAKLLEQQSRDIQEKKEQNYKPAQPANVSEIQPHQYEMDPSATMEQHLYSLDKALKDQLDQ